MAKNNEKFDYSQFDMFGHLKLLRRTSQLSWLCKFRWMQFIRLMTNTSVLPSIFLGILTISISIFFQRNSAGNYFHDLNEYIFWITFISLNALVFILVAVAGGRYFFINQPPHIYAEYTVSGSKPSDSMMYIAYCIWRECSFCRNYTDLFEKFEQMVLTGADTKKIKFNENDIKRIESFNKAFQKRFHKVKKIDYMMIELAKDMGIPAHRLSDSLFQFSPNIYLYETRIALEAMKEMAALIADYQNDLQKSSNQRVFNKVDDITVLTKRSFDNSKKIRRYWKAIYVRRDFQESILQFSDVHQSIIDMAMDYGITSSLNAYCFGIQNCFSNINDSTSYTNKANQLAFLYHKRRMCAGYDLHAILHNFIRLNFPEYAEVCEDFGSVDQDQFNKLIKVAERILFDFEKAKMEQREIIDKRFKAYIKSSLKTLLLDNRKRYEQEKTALKKEMNSTQGAGLQNLNSKIEELDGIENVVFVTKGFSSVVTSTLHSFAKAINQDNWNEIFGSLNVFVYIIYEPKDLENHATDIRYMRYKYMENPNLQKRSDNRISVKIGEVDWWKRQFANRKSINYFLSGAEFVQVKKSKESAAENGILHSHEENNFTKVVCQLMNDEGVVNILDNKDLRASLGDQLTHVVLAEEYKFFSGKLHQRAQNAFNRAYSENQKLYGYADRVALTGAKTN